ncbi:hypothetical protein [Streptomyces sp. NPDC004230]
MNTATRLTSRTAYISISSDRTSYRGVDLIAVERAVNDSLPEGMTDAELTLAAQILSEHSVSRAEVSRRLKLPEALLKSCEEKGWHPKTIATWRSNRARKQAVAA